MLREGDLDGTAHDLSARAARFARDLVELGLPPGDSTADLVAVRGVR